jgi:hypothetical protein
VSAVELAPLVGYLRRVPAITGELGAGTASDGRWWVKFRIDIRDALAWHVVQELGHVLNLVHLPELIAPSEPERTGET